MVILSEYQFDTLSMQVIVMHRNTHFFTAHTLYHFISSPGNSEYNIVLPIQPHIVGNKNSPTLDLLFNHAVLLLGVEEGKPQLGLIDYGQVKVLSKEERLLFCKLIIAIADDDKEQICHFLEEAGYRSKRMDTNIMYKFARVAYDEDNEELTEGKHIQLYMEHLHDNDPVEVRLFELGTYAFVFHSII